MVETGNNLDCTFVVTDFEDDDTVLVEGIQPQLGSDNMDNEYMRNVFCDNDQDDSNGAGILIVPPVVFDGYMNNEECNEILPNPGENTTYTNLSVPGTVPSHVPSIVPEIFTKVGNDLDTCDDVSELHGSNWMMKNSDSPTTAVTLQIKDSVSSNVVLGTRTVLVVLVLVSLSTVFYLLYEGNSWRATTMRLEATVRELQLDTDIRIQREQEKTREFEATASKEHVKMATRLHEVLARLEEEAEARTREKQKSDALELEVKRLREEIKSLDKESQRAIDLEQKVSQLQKLTQEHDRERLKAIELQEELLNLKNELFERAQVAKGNDFNDLKVVLKIEESTKQVSSKLDNCLYEGDRKGEASECAILGTEHFDLNEKKLHKNDLQDNVQDHLPVVDISHEQFSSENDKIPTEYADDHRTNQNENYSPNQIWKDLSGTLSRAHGRAMDHMAKDYSDLKSWYKDVSHSLLFQSSETDASDGGEEKETMESIHQSTNKHTDINHDPTSKSEKLKEKANEKSHFHALKDSAKTVQDHLPVVDISHEQFSSENDKIPTEYSDDHRTNQNENYSPNQIWKDLSGTLSRAHGLAMDHMVKDYSDLKSWYKDVSHSLLLHSSETDASNGGEEKETIESMHQSTNKHTDINHDPTSKSEKLKEKANEKSHFHAVKDSAKTILYSVAFASLATIAADATGSWFSTFTNEKES